MLSKIEQAFSRNQSKAGGLAGMLELNFNVRVMLTVNVG